MKLFTVWVYGGPDIAISKYFLFYPNIFGGRKDLWLRFGGS